jgi:hypothetical protein
LAEHGEEAMLWQGAEVSGILGKGE